jgi:hypothetical protein
MGSRSPAFTVAARAVDIRDPRITQEGPMYDTYLTIIDHGQTRHITLMNGELTRNVCEDCTIEIEGGNEVHASGNDMVDITGSRIADRATVTHFPETYSTANPLVSKQSRLPGSVLHFNDYVSHMDSSATTPPSNSSGQVALRRSSGTRNPALENFNARDGSEAER